MSETAIALVRLWFRDQDGNPLLIVEDSGQQ